MSGLPNHNDNVPFLSDPHGQAALLMTESLLHSLIEKGVFSVAEAIAVVETAIAVQEDAIANVGDPSATIRKSLALLEAVSTSLSHDLTDGT